MNGCGHLDNTNNNHFDENNTTTEKDRSGGYAAAIAKLIQPSHHICWFYDNYEEILEFTIQYCLDSLAQNYISICHFVDKETQEKYHKGEVILSCPPNHRFLTPNEVVSALEARGVDVKSAIESGQLRLADNYEQYIENGIFQPDKLVTQFNQELLNIRKTGYAGVRGYGDMAFVFGHIGLANARAFHEFEAKISLLQEDFPEFVGVCCFDRGLFSSFLLKDVLQTHPVAAVKEKYYKYNFYFVPPKKFLCSPDRLDDEILSAWLQNLEERNIMDKQTEVSMSEKTKRENSELKQIMQTCETNNDSLSEALAAHKQSFISNISHEIRTPLTGIMGGIDLLTATMISEDQKRLLQYLLPSVRQLSRVLSDVLAFDQEISLHKSALSLRETVQLSISEAESISAAYLDLHLDDNKIDVSATFEVPEVVVGDESRIRQVLVNLISNSIKFSNSKISVHFDIKVINRIDNKLELKFSIFDNGIGLMAGDNSKIFNSFWQHDQSTKKRYGGTGLGLAITKSLIKLMGGDISASSSGLNRGTCIEFTIWVDTIESISDTYVQDGSRGSSIASSPSCSPTLADSIPVITSIPDSSSSISSVSSVSSSPSHSPIPSPPSQSSTPSSSLSSSPSVTDLLPNQNSSDIIQDSSSFTAFAKPRSNSLLSGSPISPLSISPLSISPDQIEKGRAFMRIPADATRLTPKDIGEILVPPKNISILLVEDNAINAKIILQLLKSIGYVADLAKNGLEAVNATTCARYDIIFMDLHMPIMDGFQATEEILNRADLDLQCNYNNNNNNTDNNTNSNSLKPKRVRIFALTASASESDKKKCETVGMVGHLAKPVSKIALLHALSSLVNPTEA